MCVVFSFSKLSISCQCSSNIILEFNDLCFNLFNSSIWMCCQSPAWYLFLQAPIDRPIACSMIKRSLILDTEGADAFFRSLLTMNGKDCLICNLPLSGGHVCYTCILYTCQFKGCQHNWSFQRGGWIATFNHSCSCHFGDETEGCTDIWGVSWVAWTQAFEFLPN